MGELQLSLFVIETDPKIENKTQQTKPEKKTKSKNKKEQHSISLFKASGIRHDGFYKIEERFECLRCERKINFYPRLFCSDCKVSGAYRFSECY